MYSLPLTRKVWRVLLLALSWKSKLSANNQHCYLLWNEKKEKKRLLYFHSEFKSDYISWLLSVIFTILSEKNQVAQSKSWFIVQIQITYIGLYRSTQTGLLFWRLIWFSANNQFSHAKLALTLLIDIINVLLPQIWWLSVTESKAITPHTTESFKCI